MSEIKGQLLGLILVLVIFGAVSVGVSSIFKSSAEKITDEYGETSTAIDSQFTTGAAGAAPAAGGLAMPSNLLSY